MIETQARIQQFLTDLTLADHGQLAIVEKLRAIITGFDENLVENIKYGGLVYSYQESLVTGIFAYKRHVSLEFSQGAEFHDEAGKLEGNGKYRRHIKFLDETQIDKPVICEYLRQAILIAQ